MAQQGTAIKILSWNVRGLGSKIKRGIVSQFIKRHDLDLILLQETHRKGTVFQAMDRKGYRMVAHAGYTTDARGVGILQKKTLPLIVQATHLDSLGRYAALTGQWEGKVLNIVSVYSPPRLHEPLLKDLGSLLLTLPEGILVAGGDYNMTLSAKDRWRVLGNSRWLNL